MIPMLVDQGVACTPFSSLAHGVFAKPYDAERTDGIGLAQTPEVLAADAEIIRRTYEVAAKHNVSTSVIAQAWNLSKPYITSPLICPGPCQ